MRMETYSSRDTIATLADISSHLHEAHEGALAERAQLEWQKKQFEVAGAIRMQTLAEEYTSLQKQTEEIEWALKQVR